jgi:hypothetical protein
VIWASSPKQLAIDLRRRAKDFPDSSEDHKLAIATAKYLEQLAAKTDELPPYPGRRMTGDELGPYLKFLEEKGVPLTPEQKADLGIDSDDE